MNKLDQFNLLRAEHGDNEVSKNLSTESNGLYKATAQLSDDEELTLSRDGNTVMFLTVVETYRLRSFLNEWLNEDV